MLVITRMTNQYGDARFTRNLYHNQWGYGRQMFVGMMSSLTNYLATLAIADARPTTDGFYNYFSSRNGNDLTESEEKEQAEALQGILIDDMGKVRELYKTLDNNCGGLVLQLDKEDGADKPVRVRAGFLCGFKHNGFGRFVSPEEYVEKEGADWVTQDFLEAFKAFCDYFNVEWMGGDE